MFKSNGIKDFFEIEDDHFRKNRKKRRMEIFTKKGTYNLLKLSLLQNYLILYAKYIFDYFYTSIFFDIKYIYKTKNICKYFNLINI